MCVPLLGKDACDAVRKRWNKPISLPEFRQKTRFPLAGKRAACRKSPPTASFSEIYAVSLSPPWGSRAGNGARKPCTARLPNPPHMSPDSDCIWRALALQTSRKGFLTVCAFSPCWKVRSDRLKSIAGFWPGKPAYAQPCHECHRVLGFENSSRKDRACAR